MGRASCADSSSEFDSVESRPGHRVHPWTSGGGEALDAAPVGQQHFELLPRCPGSRPASATSRAPWSRIAPISAGRDAMCGSRLMITQLWAVTIGIQSGPSPWAM